MQASEDQKPSSRKRQLVALPRSNRSLEFSKLIDEILDPHFPKPPALIGSIASTISFPLFIPIVCRFSSWWMTPPKKKLSEFPELGFDDHHTENAFWLAAKDGDIESLRKMTRYLKLETRNRGCDTLSTLLNCLEANDIATIKTILSSYDTWFPLSYGHVNQAFITKVLAILAIEIKHFEAADLFIKHSDIISDYKISNNFIAKTVEESREKEKKQIREKIELHRPVKTSEHIEKLLIAYKRIGYLLVDIPTCIQCLKDLDGKLQIPSYMKRNIKDERFLNLSGHPWPFPSENITQTFKTNSNTERKLVSILLKKIRSQSINPADDVATFVGYVDGKDADAVIASGNVFKEARLPPANILHGPLLHLLQLYAIITALEKNYLALPDGITVLDVWKNFVSDTFRSSENESMWNALIDIALGHRTFQSPLFFNCFLLNSHQELPNLSSYLFYHYQKHLRKFLQFSTEDFRPENPSKLIHLIIAQDLNGEVFTYPFLLEKILALYKEKPEFTIPPDSRIIYESFPNENTLEEEEGTSEIRLAVPLGKSMPMLTTLPTSTKATSENPVPDETKAEVNHRPLA